VYSLYVQQLFHKALRIYLVYYEHLLRIPYYRKKKTIIITIVCLIHESQDIRITNKRDTIQI